MINLEVNFIKLQKRDMGLILWTAKGTYWPICTSPNFWPIVHAHESTSFQAFIVHVKHFDISSTSRLDSLWWVGNICCFCCSALFICCPAVGLSEIVFLVSAHVKLDFEALSLCVLVFDSHHRPKKRKRVIHKLSEFLTQKKFLLRVVWSNVGLRH